MPAADHPLEAPRDRALLRRYLEYFGLREGPDRRQVLADVARAFARLPYENLTKIIRRAEAGTGEDARRGPDLVIGDHFRFGAGGTCFSLTAALLYLLRSLGWRAEPILADRRYGANTHCALLVWIDDHPHLLDPGYLIVDPIPLDPGRRQQIVTEFNEVRLEPQAAGDRLDLLTAVPGAPDRQTTYRLTFKTAPVDAGEFLRVWDESFDWDMMQYPVLTRVQGGAQRYLQGSRLQIRRHEHVERAELPADSLVEQITQQFGIDPAIVKRALGLLRK